MAARSSQPQLGKDISPWKGVTKITLITIQEEIIGQKKENIANRKKIDKN